MEVRFLPGPQIEFNGREVCSRGPPETASNELKSSLLSDKELLSRRLQR